MGSGRASRLMPHSLFSAVSLFASRNVNTREYVHAKVGRARAFPLFAVLVGDAVAARAHSISLTAHLLFNCSSIKSECELFHCLHLMNCELQLTFMNCSPSARTTVHKYPQPFWMVNGAQLLIMPKTCKPNKNGRIKSNLKWKYREHSYCNEHLVAIKCHSHSLLKK